MSDPHAEDKERHAALLAAALVAVYADVRTDVLGRLEATGDALNLLASKWRHVVEAVTAKGIKDAVQDIGTKAVDGDFTRTVDPYLDAVAENSAKGWDNQLAARFNEIAAEVDATFEKMRQEVEVVLDDTVDAAESDANDLVDLAGNFAAMEAAEQEGLATKTWHNRDFTHPRHNDLEGVTVPLDARFPNGLRYPHAPGPPGETLNCKCYLTFGR